jgi:hypothetical protein
MSAGRDLIAEAAAIFEDLVFGLERYADVMGDARARHAALILRGRKGGRPAIDDDAALVEIGHLVDEGKSLAVALGIVARQMPEGNAESVKRRLRRKLEKSRTQ